MILKISCDGCGKVLTVDQALLSSDMILVNDLMVAENKRLKAIIDKLLEVGDDLRVYTHQWDWKYGEYWDKGLNEAREAAGAAKEE